MSNKEILKITSLNIEVIKAICKEENVVWYNSSYGGKRFAFKIDDEIKTKYRGMFTQDNISSIIIIEGLFRMLCTCHEVTKELAYKCNLYDNDIKLLRRCYFDLDTHNGEEVITLAYKRPFGNSNVIGDYLEVYNLYQYDSEGEVLEMNYEEMYEEDLNETITKIYHYLLYIDIDKDLEVEKLGYGRYTPSVNYLRKKKIKRLIKNN